MAASQERAIEDAVESTYNTELELPQPSNRMNRSMLSMSSKRFESLAEKETETIIRTFDLSEAEVEEIRKCFDLFDIYGTGAITPLELQKASKSVGRELTEEDVVEIIAEIDESREKNEIDFLDFLTVMGKSTKESLLETDIEHVFNTFDQNKDTFICPNDMHKTFVSLGVDLSPAELNVIFEEYDEDRDGLINYEEFKPLVEEAHLEITKFEQQKSIDEEDPDDEETQ